MDFANAKSGKRKSKKETALAGSNPCDITEEEIPFDIPENWCWCRLGEICTFENGDRSSNYPVEIDYTSDGIPFFGAADMKNNKLLFSDNLRFISEEKFDSLRSGKLQNKDYVMLLRGAVGKWAQFLNHGKYSTGFINTQMVIIRAYESIVEYIKVLFNSPIFEIFLRSKTTGTAVAQMSAKDLSTLLIPLPPLAEQKRIVAAIEKFMPLIEEYGKKETQLKVINEKIGTLTKKAILQEAVQGKLVPQIAAEGNARDLLEEIRKEKLSHGLDFANAKSGKRKSKEETALAGSNPCDITEEEIPFEIPESWCWCRLSELCNLYTGDSINETEKKLKYTNVKEGWFYIGTKDVNFDQTINYDNGIKIPFEKDNFRIAPKNTVLMCIEGGSAGRKIAFTNQDVCFGNKLCCFNSYKNEIEKFIFYFLQSTLFTDAFKDNINGIIGGVSINNLKGMLFPLPPLAEQKRIVATIEKILPLCEKSGE